MKAFLTKVALVACIGGAMLLSACSGTGQTTVPQRASNASGSLRPMDVAGPIIDHQTYQPDVALGGNGDVWVENGGLLWQSTNGGASFTYLSTVGQVDIAGDPSGNLWMASADAISKWNGSAWQTMPGQASDIAIAGNGTVWTLSRTCTSTAGGCTIYRSTDGGQTYTQIPGYATSISADADGNAWITNSSGSIYYYNGSSFTQVSGTGSDIAVATNGTVWVLGNCSSSTGCDIYYSTNKGASFTQVSGSAIDIAVDANNIPWVMNASGHLYKATDATASGWTEVPF